jgi:hypothetical protein
MHYYSSLLNRTSDCRNDLSTRFCEIELCLFSVPGILTHVFAQMGPQFHQFLMVVCLIRKLHAERPGVQVWEPFCSQQLAAVYSFPPYMRVLMVLRMLFVF